MEELLLGRLGCCASLLLLVLTNSCLMSSRTLSAAKPIVITVAHPRLHAATAYLVLLPLALRSRSLLA